MMPCALCGIEVILRGRVGLEKARKGRAYCSEEHAKTWFHNRISESSKLVSRRHAAAYSERMRLANPMNDPAVKLKAVASRRKVGKWFTSGRGGNGKPLPVPQSRLLVALGKGWVGEFVVKTGLWKMGSQGPSEVRYPSHYKVDIACPEKRIAIEVDGESHRTAAVKKKDDKKANLLRSFGWQVFRFSNQEAMERTADCVRMALSTT